MRNVHFPLSRYGHPEFGNCLGEFVQALFHPDEQVGCHRNGKSTLDG
jgi:hypothetical protein